MSFIKEVVGRKILDSRGKETVEVRIKTDDGLLAIDSVPSGTSTGKYEATLVRPDIAVGNINKIIAPKIIGQDVQLQQVIDQKMIELDGTANKSKLGANAILGVSLAIARAAALAAKMPLFWYLNRLLRKMAGVEIEPAIPTSMMVMICGGKHGVPPGGGKSNNLCIQEFLVIGQTEHGKKIWHEIEKILKKRKIAYKLGLEGGFSPALDYDEDALEIIIEAINNCQLNIGQEIQLGIDVSGDNCQMSNKQVENIFNKYGLYSVEDPFGEKDWEKFGQLKVELSQTNRDYLIIGDDLFATHKKLLQRGINDLVANGIVIKVNQVGALSETLEVITLAKKANYKCVISHRSGETMDTFIADLAVGVAAEFLKSGAPIPRERILKYNRLKEIEEEL